eukprot:TRINITY_DN31400_c0_g1_i1.p1 TRINITY_DN31400_c0_g1~~TRINITY_DN31400_c0_g1_i1.p1  ORF type:complete len:260 (-),score=32.98 TRINITY_DN31400_c0_g1_i1:159-905(-)
MASAEVVESYDAKPFNLSATGAPWGGQSTIWDAYRDLLLAEKGRYLEPANLKPPTSPSSRPGSEQACTSAEQRTDWCPPRNPTLRRMSPQLPASVFDSSRYAAAEAVKKQQPSHQQHLPSAKTRLETDGELLGDMKPLQPCPRRREVQPQPPLHVPGSRRCDWDRAPASSRQASGAAFSSPSRANSTSPRYAPLRYGASIMRRHGAQTCRRQAPDRGSPAPDCPPRSARQQTFHGPRSSNVSTVEGQG